MTDLGNGYRGQEYNVTYAAQRWLVIFSRAAYDRECKTLIKHCKKGSEKEVKAFEKLQREVFSCPADALKHYEKIAS